MIAGMSGHWARGGRFSTGVSCVTPSACQVSELEQACKRNAEALGEFVGGVERYAVDTVFYTGNAPGRDAAVSGKFFLRPVSFFT